MEAGLDSLGAVELRNSLASRFGVELAATVTIDYPTAAALAMHIASLAQPVKKPRISRRKIAASASEGPRLIDIVGASCVYSGASSS